MREGSAADEVVAVSIGPKQSVDTLRTALGMGADRGIHIDTDAELQPLAVAKLLAEVARREQPRIFMLGKQAIDDDSNQTGQMLAGLLGWPQGTFASKVVMQPGNQSVQVTREVDGGLETVQLRLPAVVTADLRLNQPRYATLPNIMKAKKKPIEVLRPEALGVNVTPQLQTVQIEEPAKRKGAVMLKSPAELVGRLRNEAKLQL